MAALFTRLGLGVLLVCVCSCRTTPMLPPVNLSQAGWSVRMGQAVWQPPGRAPELAGDLQFAMNASGDAFIQFTKTPLPFVSAQIRGEEWEIHFIPQKRVLPGRGTPSARVPWLQLALGLQGKETTGGWKFTKTGGDSWRIENAKTGEWVEGFLR